MAASKAFLVAVAIVASIVAPALAKEFVVGDDNGWKLKVDYQQWAAGKEFRVGDTLVFNYEAGKHNVVKANMTEFQSCSTSSLSAAPFTSGHTVIPLLSPGKKWYICSFPNHCHDGPLKLAINVWPDAYSPAPAPTTGSNGAIGITAPSLMIAAMVSVFVIMIVA